MHFQAPNLADLAPKNRKQNAFSGAKSARFGAYKCVLFCFRFLGAKSARFGA
jgi:hypothetical protein